MTTRVSIAPACDQGRGRCRGKGKGLVGLPTTILVTLGDIGSG